MTYRPALVTTRYGPAAFDALASAVAAAKGGEALAPVTIVVPTNAMGVAVRRHLARRRPGIAAVSVLTVFRLAELLGAARLAAAGRRPVSSPVLLAALRRELRHQPGVMAAVATHPATEEAMVSAYRELADLDAGALARLAGGSERAGDVVRVVRAARRRLAPLWYDEADLLDAAGVELTVAPSRVRELGTVVVHLPHDVGRRAGRFLAHLGGQTSLTIVAGLTGAPDADRAVHRSVHRLGASAAPPSLAAPVPAPPRLDPPPLVITASDADDEVRAAIAVAVEAARTGTPLAEIAIVHCSDQPYCRLITDQLSAAALAWTGPDPRRLGHHVAGRFVLDLLALPVHDYQRADVHGLLAAAPVVDRDGRAVPAPTWERLACSAGVVAGRDEWNRRLTLAAASRRDRAGDPEWGGPHLVRQAEQSEHLRTFVLDLIDRLERLRLAASWSSLAGGAHALLRRLLGDDRVRTHWPERERLAAERVEAVLDRLGRLDPVDPSPDLERFRRALALELDSDLGRHGRLGEGIVAGPLASAMGLELSLVIVVGMVEGLLPAPPAPDPLLPDIERASAGDLALAADGPARQHHQLLAAVAAGRRVVLCRPRGDLRRASTHHPSRWLSELVDTDHPELTRSSFAGALATTSFPATEQELHLHQLLAGAPDLLAHDVAFQRASTLVRARASPALTAYDGDVSAADGSMRQLRDRPVAVTGLETWARCPFDYFLRTVLGVAPLEAPEAAQQINAVDAGELVHRVLERFVVDALTLVPTALDWCEPAHLRRLDALAEEAFADVEARGLTGKPVFWRHDRHRIWTYLRAYLAADSARLAERSAVPLAGELRFGWPGTPAVELMLAGGRRVAFRGSIDRVDRCPDGTLLVTDYKTGSSKYYSGLSAANPHGGGERFQLAVYAAAARAAYGDGPAEAHYRFVSDPGRSAIGYVVDDAVTTEVSRAIKIVVDGIEGGLFPARPAEGTFTGYIPCASCDPDGLGTGDRRRQWEHKQGDIRLADYLELVGVTAGVAEVARDGDGDGEGDDD